MSREIDGFMARQPTAVDHAFTVLEAVAELGAGVTARVLVERLPFSRATVYRLLKHLVAEEYLVRTADLSGFALGARVRALGHAALLSGQIDPVANPVVDAGR